MPLVLAGIQVSPAEYRFLLTSYDGEITRQNVLDHLASSRSVSGPPAAGSLEHIVRAARGLADSVRHRIASLQEAIAERRAQLDRTADPAHRAHLDRVLAGLSRQISDADDELTALLQLAEANEAELSAVTLPQAAE